MVPPCHALLTTHSVCFTVVTNKASPIPITPELPAYLLTCVYTSSNSPHPSKSQISNALERQKTSLHTQLPTPTTTVTTTTAAARTRATSTASTTATARGSGVRR